MTKHKAPRTVAQTIVGLGQILARATGSKEDELRLRISQVIAVWGAERSNRTFLKAVAEFDRFIGCWRAGSDDVDRPLYVDAIAETATSLRRAGAPDGSILAYLTAVTTLLNRFGFVTPEFRSGLLQLRKNHTPRSTRRPWKVNVPTLHAEVVRLVRGGDAALPRDVRNLVMVLVIFEGMAQFSELTGPTTRGLTSKSLQVSDICFDAGGTSVISLVAVTANGVRRSVRLSADATVWLKHWLGMRGEEPGPLFSYGRADPRGPQVTSHCDSMPLWQGPTRFAQLALRHGTSGFDLTAESLRLCRAVGLLDAGWSVSRVAMAGGWTSTAALIRLLDRGLSVLPSERRRREPRRLAWPLPYSADEIAMAPCQLSLRLVDRAA